MVDCSKCPNYVKEVNVCKLFNMQLQRLAQVDECDMDPDKQLSEG